MKEIVFRHFEKGIFALCALLLVGLANPLLGRPRELDDVGKFRELQQNVAHHFGNAAADVPPAPDLLTPLRASVAPSVSVERFPAWVLHRRPNLAYDIIEVKDPRPSSSHGAPKLEVVVGHGVVTVTWGQGPGNEGVITTYVVTRTDSKGATTILRETTEPGTLNDVQVEARASYTYTVTETAEPAPGYKPLDPKTVALAAEKPATLPRDWVILPTDWVKIDDLLKTPVDVKVFIYRWKDGQWHSGEHQLLKVGEKIGKKGARLDFSSGAELLEIEQKDGVTSIRVKWPNGSEERARSTDIHEGIKHRRR